MCCYESIGDLMRHYGNNCFAECQSSKSTRQIPKNTQQKFCWVPSSAYLTRPRFGWQRALCRVLFVGHTSKTLPSASATLSKRKAMLTAWRRWQSVCWVPWWLNTRQKLILCRVSWMANAANTTTLPSTMANALNERLHFAECTFQDTRQNYHPKCTGWPLWREFCH